MTAAAGCLLYDIGFWHDAGSRRPVLVALLATAGVTAFGMLAARIRQQRTRELARVRLVAEVAQQVLMRPLPARAGPVTMASGTCQRPGKPGSAGTCTNSWPAPAGCG